MTECSLSALPTNIMPTWRGSQAELYRREPSIQEKCQLMADISSARCIDSAYPSGLLRAHIVQYPNAPGDFRHGQH
jgi:hypothetical protein